MSGYQWTAVSFPVTLSLIQSMYLGLKVLYGYWSIIAILLLNAVVFVLAGHQVVLYPHFIYGWLVDDWLARLCRRPDPPHRLDRSQKRTLLALAQFTNTLTIRLQRLLRSRTIRRIKRTFVNVISPRRVVIRAHRYCYSRLLWSRTTP